MNAPHFLTVSDIEKEMNTGKATVKFLLKRFSKWLPHSIENGLLVYDPQIITTLFHIQEKLESGQLPSEIETDLDTSSISIQKKTGEVSNPPEDIRMSKDSLLLIKSLFTDIGIVQERIAIAHEKRAQAEERKAVAIEKRAEAEEKKAQAMNNIAQALQEMNHSRNNPAVRQLAREATSAIVADEISDDSLEKAFSNSIVLEHHDTDMDDDHSLDDLNGLSSLIDDDPEENRDEPFSWTQTDGLIESIEETAEPLDDLSFLIDTEQEPLDDLSLLVNTVSEPLDDLSLLIDDEEDTELLDDLSLLIDKDEDTELIDDLSLLIDEDEDTELIDDLSLLIDEDEDTELLDDLSLLIEDPVENDFGTSSKTGPSFIKPAVAPEDDPAQYKSAIMNIIIQLKSDGFSVEEVTDSFNREGVQTLTGKDKWGTKPIAQIYKFIDTATAS